MPAQLMDDGTEHMRASRPNGDSKLFASFSTSAQRLGVYTALDYAEVRRARVRALVLRALAMCNMGAGGKARTAFDPMRREWRDHRRDRSDARIPRHHSPLRFAEQPRASVASPTPRKRAEHTR